MAHVQEYYDYQSVTRHMTEKGMNGSAKATASTTIPSSRSTCSTTDPYSIRFEERVAADKAARSTAFRSRIASNVPRAGHVEIVEFRASHTDRGDRKSYREQRERCPHRREGPGPSGARPEPDPRSMGGGDCAANAYNCADAPNPLPPGGHRLDRRDDVDGCPRRAERAGKTTAIIATGGVEPNGPWLVTGKHNYVLRANCDAIARELGNAVSARR